MTRPPQSPYRNPNSMVWDELDQGEGKVGNKSSASLGTHFKDCWKTIPCADLIKRIDILSISYFEEAKI